MNIYDVPELQQYLDPVFNQQLSTQLIDPTMLFRQRSPLLGIQSQRLNDPQMTLLPQIPRGITASSAAQDVSPIPFGTSVDNIQGFTDKEDFSEPETKTGIAKLFEFIQKFSPINIVGQLLPQQDPRAINMRNFYGSQYGLTPTGSLASGIMAGYNPISGGLFGSRVNYGLANAARKRIEKIANRKAPQTDASRAKIKELQEFADRDTISRARQAAPDVYKSAERQGFTGPRGGFSTSGREGAFSSKTGRGRQDY